MIRFVKFQKELLMKVRQYQQQKQRRNYYEFKIVSPQIPKESDYPQNLYKIKEFEDFSVQSSNLENSDFQKYFNMVPFQLESYFYGHRKHYVINMDLYEKSQLIKLTSLGLSGKYEKFISIKNIVPVTYSDYRASCKRTISDLPDEIDWEMIYFNPIFKEFYVFDKQGEWNEKNINNSSLLVENLYDERKFLDCIRIV